MSGHLPTSPSVYEDQRLAGLTDFRCEVCQCRYPFELMVEQDGHRVCQPNCAYTYAPSVTQILADEARVEAAQLTTATVEAAALQLAQAPNYSLMDGVSVATGLTSGSITYPTLISLSPGGASAPFVLTGIGFTITDLLTFSNAGITVGAASISTDETTLTTTVSASGAVVPGDYDFLFNGTRWPRAIRVRT